MTTAAEAPKWINERAMRWVFYEAPDVPASCVSTLSGIAARANGDGTEARPLVNGWNAYPGIPLLVTVTRKSPRQVARDIETLLTLKLLRIPVDQSAAASIPADRRPTVYDLGYSPVRPFIDPAELDVNKKGRRRRPGQSPLDLSSMTGRDLGDPIDLSPMSGRDLSSMTERPVIHDHHDLSSTTGKEDIEEDVKNTRSSRKRSAAKPREHAVADELVDGFWERYGSKKLQKYIAVRGIIRTAIDKGIDRDELAHALDRLGRSGKPVSNGTLEFAISQRQEEIARRSQGGARSGHPTHEDIDNGVRTLRI